jgi:hypothetical protein
LGSASLSQLTATGLPENVAARDPCFAGPTQGLFLNAQGTFSQVIVISPQTTSNRFVTSVASYIFFVAKALYLMKQRIFI